MLFSRSWYRHTIVLAPEDQFVLPAGDFFVLVRPYNPTSNGWSFWLTAFAPPESQSQSYFRSDYYGYPTWTPGDQIFGGEYDVNFRLYGKYVSQGYSDRPFSSSRKVVG